MNTEAWYVTASSDSCTGPIDCSLLPELNFPEGTLHVGISTGTPTTATFVEIDLFGASIPAGSEVTGGTLRLPIDPEPRDGSLQPETADLVVCAVTDFLVDANGSLKKPPKTDCEAASAPAKFVSESAPAFTVDLTPFAKKLTDGDGGLAIMPSGKAAKDSQTWHVTFWAKDDGEAEDAAPLPAGEVNPKPISATLTHAPTKTGVTAPPTTENVALPPVDSPPVEEVESAGPVDAAPAPAPAPKEAESPAEAAAPLAAPELITFGYQYPIAWLFPLLLLIGFAATGHSLTKRLERPAGFGSLTQST